MKTGKDLEKLASEYLDISKSIRENEERRGTIKELLLKNGSCETRQHIIMIEEKERKSIKRVRVIQMFDEAVAVELTDITKYLRLTVRKKEDQ